MKNQIYNVTVEKDGFEASFTLHNGHRGENEDIGRWIENACIEVDKSINNCKGLKMPKYFTDMAKSLDNLLGADSMWWGYIGRDKKIHVEPYTTFFEMRDPEDDKNILVRTSEFPANSEEEAMEKTMRLLEQFSHCLK